MRDRGINPHLVRVVGHYGKPQFGIVASRRKGDLVDVVVTSAAYVGARTERITVRDAWVKRISVANTALFSDHELTTVLQNLVDAGALRKCERRDLLNARKRAHRAADRRAHKVKWSVPYREWANIGAGKMTIDFIRANGLVR